MERSDFTVHGVKTFRGMEGRGYNATIKYKGKKVAEVIDDATGGELSIEWADSGYHNFGELTPLESEICDFAEGLPCEEILGHKVECCVEMFFEDLVEDYLENQSLKRKCRTKILYRDDKDDIYAIDAAPPVTPEIRAKIKSWGGVEVINDRFAKPQA